MMLEEISTQGYWWVENDEDRAVAGELSYQPGGRIELKLLSPLGEGATSMASGEAVEYDRIHGVTEDGDEVTLLNCTRSNASLNIGNSGVQTSEFVATHFLTGHAFTQGEDISFKSAIVEFPLLDEWAGITGVSIDYGFGDMWLC